MLPSTANASRRRMAIVGLGMAVAPHAQSLRDLAGRVDVAAAFSPTRARRDAFAAQFAFPVTGDLDSILDDRSIDAVLILTPPRTHLPLVERFAAAGKHVLLEKPLEVNTSRAETLVEACERAGVTLGVVVQHRFRPGARALAAAIAEQRLGSIVAASVAVPWWRPQSYYDEPGRGTLARDGGGVLLTQAIHTLDLFLSVAPPLAEVAAYAATTAVHRMETEDIACAALRFNNGALGTLNATTASYPGLSGAHRRSSARSAAHRCAAATSTFTSATGGTKRPASANTHGGGADPMAFAHDAHRAVIGEFLDALDAGRAPANSGRAVLPVHDLIDAVLASSQARAPVPVRQRPHP